MTDQHDPNRQPSCAERIASSLEGTIAGMREALDADKRAEEIEAGDLESDEDPDEIRSSEGSDAWINGVLSLEVLRRVRVQLSWGGPSSELELRIDSEGEIVGASYLFADWFDSARVEVEGEDLETVCAVLGSYCETLTELEG